MRFIHLADVHLGAVPDRGCPWSEKREEEIWETFRRVIAGIRENPVDFLFISGDLFHRQPLLRELKEVSHLFSSISGTRIYLMAGNHDYLRKDSFYRGFPWPENVVFFENEKLICVRDPGQEVYVYGLSYEHREIEQPLYDGARPMEGAGFHILLAHGGDATHIPINVKALASAGFDYLALGHIHKPAVLLRDRAAYAGALEPIDRGDYGAHGYIEGRTEGGRLKISFVPFASRSYQQLILNVTENSTQLSLEEELKEEIYRRGGLNMYRVILQGVRPPEQLLIPEKLKTYGNVTEVLDESRPAYDLAKLARQYQGTLIGDYIQHFWKKNRSIVEDKALFYGLQALLQTTKS